MKDSIANTLANAPSPRSHEGGVEGRVVGGIMAVAAGALPMQHRDVRGVDAERVGEPLAQLEHALRMGPDLELAVPEFRQRAGRPDRAVGQERPRISGLDY